MDRVRETTGRWRHDFAEACSSPIQYQRVWPWYQHGPWQIHRCSRTRVPANRHVQFVCRRRTANSAVGRACIQAALLRLGWSCGYV